MVWTLMIQKPLPLPRCGYIAFDVYALIAATHCHCWMLHPTHHHFSIPWHRCRGNAFCIIDVSSTQLKQHLIR
jgi:hypothetical protein